MKISLLRRLILPSTSFVAALLLMSGCSESPSTSDHGHSHDEDGGHSQGEDSGPPHGGTPVLVAADEFHLELVHDTSAARIQAYVLDGHLESYVPVAETNFLLIATMDDGENQLNFRRVKGSASDANSEKSSLFETEAEWLKSSVHFEGRIPAITLNGNRFTNITFSFPEGSKHVH